MSAEGAVGRAAEAERAVSGGGGASTAAASSGDSVWVWSYRREAAASAGILGGKGSNLAHLAALGQPVPAWYVVSTEAFRRALAAGGLDRRIARRLLGSGVRGLPAAAAEIGGWIRNLELPADLERTVRRAHRQLLSDDAAVAVRSSAADEDGAAVSFAGLHASILSVCGPEAVLAALREVWASAYGEGALSFRQARGLPLDGIAMGVVVQKMIAPRASGVLFTANPATGDVHEIVINSLFGTGEGLFGEGLDADRFTVDKVSLEVRSELAQKREQLAVVEGAQRLQRQGVPEELQRVSSLTPEQVAALTQTSLAIERHLGRPQDIEFAIDGEGRIFLLQTRPITTVEEYGPAAGNRCLWDVENWAENYPGVTLPMTYSVVRRWDRIGRRCFAEMFRIDQRTVRAHPVVFDANLGYIRGRICSNGVERYRFFRLVPGFDFNRQGLLALLRIGPREIDREIDDAPPGWWRRHLVELPALLRLIGALVLDFFKVRSLVDDLLARSRRFHQRCAARDFRATPPHELVTLYDQAETELVWSWRIPMLNALFLRFLYVVLKKLCASWCGDTTGSLPNELLHSEDGSQSGRALHQLLDLAHEAYQDPALRQLFARLTPQELAARIPADPACARFAADVERYLDRYYFKGVCEMKLEGETLRDRPELLYQRIRSYLRSDDPEGLAPEVRHQRARRARGEAEERAFGAFGHRRSLLPRRLIFGWLLGKLRFLDEHREDIKFMRLQLLGLLRELLRALGERMAEEGVLARARDIFYLGIEEVADYVRGNALSTDPRALVALRRAEVEAWESDAEGKPDDLFETYGMVYHRNRFKSRRRDEPAAEDGQLRGTGCCHGVVTGTTLTLADPTAGDELAGEILVVERIHTGWIPLFPSISGLLVERGEILSHSTTVAREMGIPTIVGIPGLLATLPSGQQVRMDGAAGTVEIL